jgi:hypothetical protein
MTRLLYFKYLKRRKVLKQAILQTYAEMLG